MSAPSLGNRVVSAHVISSVEVLGREAELAALHAAFVADWQSRGPVVHVLTGLGGVGKSSLARAYAQRHLDEYDVVWWVRAEDPAVASTEFRGLLEILRPYEASRVHDAVAAAHTLLANRNRPWLLILDNVPDPAAARMLLPPAGQGQVVVTSRATTWAERTSMMEVTPLNRQAAAELLTSLSGDEDPVAADDLVEELGGLPLALAQAGFYTRTNALTLAGYRRLYQTRRAELHDEGQAPDYDHTVATTWKLAVNQLSITARAVLNLLCFYDPDSIPLHLLLAAPPQQLELDEQLEPLLQPLLDDELARHRAIGELAAYSLVTHMEPPGTVSVHRLIRTITYDCLAEPRLWANAAHTLLTAAFPRFPTTAATLARWKALHTHTRALLHRLPANHRDTLATRHRLADWTGEAGDATGARDLLAGLVSDCERALGSDDRETLATRRHFARWTGEAGDAAGARDLLAGLVSDCERALGSDDRETLATRRHFARWTGEAGDAAGARDLLAGLVSDCERALGSDDRETLATRRTFARWTGEAGDAAGARDLCVQLLPDAERILGPDHPDTLFIRRRLASWTGAGDAAGARDLCVQLLPDAERVLGPDHPYTLFIRRDLARWTAQAGDVTRALELSAKLLPDYQRVLGPDHPDTLMTRRHLARWTGEAGDVAGARDLCAQLLPDADRILGRDHPHTLAIRRQFATWTGEAGDAVAACQLFARLLTDCHRVLGPDDPDILATRRRYAHWIGEAGDTSRARDLFAQLLADYQRGMGNDHPATKMTRDELHRWTKKAR